MNIDSINRKDAELASAIEETLKIIQRNLINPFYKVVEIKCDFKIDMIDFSI